MTITQFRQILELARIGLAEIAKNTSNPAEAVAEVASAIAEGKRHLLSWEAVEAKKADAPVHLSSNSG